MNMTAQSVKTLLGNPVMRALSAFVKRRETQLYLVGGSVRDLLLGRQITDIDFTLASDAVRFAKAFAAEIGAICIVLEEDPPTARVIVKPRRSSHTAQLSLDFTKFRAASLTGDLRLRDLTINAMAVAFENTETFTDETYKHNCLGVVDPCGGMKDLEKGMLRFPSEQVIIADPLRLLRIYRFAGQLDFEISPDSITLVKKYRSMVANVASERSRGELIRIFALKQAHPYLKQMAASGLLTHLIPNLKGEVWRFLEAFEKNPIPSVLHAYSKEINDYLGVELGAEVCRSSLIKCALLLSANFAGIPEQLRFSRKAVQFMATLISGGETFENTPQRLTQRQIIRFMRTYPVDWWGVLLYSTALYPLDPVMLKQVVDTYYEYIIPIRKQGRLITGNDLIQTFDLREGTQIGSLLKEVEERQFNGEIRTREEALAVLAALIQKPV